MLFRLGTSLITLREFTAAAIFTRQLHQLKQANDLRSGNIIESEGRLLEVVKQVHNQGAGRQLGNVQLELRDILSGSKSPMKMRPSEMIPVVRLDEKPYSYLYTEGKSFHLMDNVSFDQVTLDLGLLGNQAAYLHEGVEVTVHMHDDKPVKANVPSTLTLKVTEAAPSMKGETAAPQYKKAVLEGGAVVQVPPFVQTGDHIVVDTVKGEFIRRGS